MKALVTAVGLLYWLVTPGYCAAVDKSPTAIDRSVPKIYSIEVRGNQLITSDCILKLVKTKPGDVFDRQRLMSDLESVNKLGCFNNNTLRLIPAMEPGHGVKVTIYVQENPCVTGFTFVGNHVFDSFYLRKFFANQVGQPQNFDALSKSIDALEQDYKRIGMPFARVTDVKESPDGTIELMICERRGSTLEDHATHFAIGSATKYFQETRSFLLSGNQPFGSSLLTPHTVPRKPRETVNVAPVWPVWSDWRTRVDVFPAILLPNESELY